ncbi:Fe-S cluster assembly protein SufD [Alsobacter sp. SYSU M60028]|uniref:Fe-S cluster assembly protein SufD n=1 Tax=Alsobacter ponti TaxID=2962936 RepID=A0ABT1LGQ1_9HYPH|nr:Fe-S cluster assembly protein SufD [Alsobacter ponti]MCP8940288.1 Fe-S cluster assembly protein SufD [Alsobacter ponti]
MADVTPIRTAAETALAELFPAVKGRLPGDATIAGQRAEAFKSFVDAGLPHRRIEAYKYTDLRALLRDVPPLATEPSADAVEAARQWADPFAGVDALRFTIVDGHVVAGLSDFKLLPDGVEAWPLAAALSAGPVASGLMGRVAPAKSDPVLALNAALMTDGLVVRVRKDVALDRPILVRFLAASGAPSLIVTRILLVVEDGARATLIESHEGAGVAHHANTAVEISCGDDAIVHHLRANASGQAGVDLSTLGVDVGGRCAFTSVAMVTAPSLSRHQIFVRCTGEHSTVTLGGGALLKNRQHADTTLVVDHAVPDCVSRELYKTVLDDEATGVFQGKIIVQQPAQKTDGKMMSQAVLLADGPTMNNKPELEIFADDVQCAHGATCGALDDDLLFYLRARGLPKPEAEALMLRAFVGEALELVDDEAARERLDGMVAAWLAARA